MQIPELGHTSLKNTHFGAISGPCKLQLAHKQSGLTKKIHVVAPMITIRS